MTRAAELHQTECSIRVLELGPTRPGPAMASEFPTPPRTLSESHWSPGGPWQYRAAPPLGSRAAAAGGTPRSGTRLGT
jgi:hypothetical protein